MKRFITYLLLGLSVSLSWAGVVDGDSVADVSAGLEGCCGAFAYYAPNRPPALIFTAEGGWARVLDTYLTPIAYKGWHTALEFEHTQSTAFDRSRWVRQLALGVTYDNVDNLVGSNTMHHLRAVGRWALMRRWDDVLASRLSLMGGGMTWLHGGVVYNDANSNNPASVKAHWTLGMQGIAQYATRLGRVPVYLRYQVSLPVAGVWFSPEYGESYYEIYLGNHRNLAQVGWWGNRFDLDHRVTADFRLGGTILRVGYHGVIERSWAHHSNTHITAHGIVIGIGGEFFARGGRNNPHAWDKSVY